jgi:hypothetical protein
VAQAESKTAVAGHTPGPWLVQDERDGAVTVWVRQPHTGTLATFHDEDLNGPYPANANAQLAAAAPDMFRTLEAIDKVFSRLPWDAEAPALNDAVELMGDLARTAIAKAAGVA